MALYLQMDGVDDYIKLPSMTLSRIVATVKIRRRTDVTRFIWDFRTGIGFSYLQQTTGGLDTWGSGTVKVDGVTKTNSTVAIANDTKTVIDHTLSTGTDDGNIFINNSAQTTSTISGDIFDIKIYNGATLIAWYDMTKGNVLDQSGNSNNATLNGGTWLDDGTGGATATGATITGVVAESTADALAPTVTTTSSVSVSVSAVAADATADSIAPSVSAGTTINVQITGVVATSTADSLAPSISGEAVLSSVVADAIASALNPVISTTSSIDVNVLSTVADSFADAIAPRIGNIVDAVIEVIGADTFVDGYDVTIETTIVKPPVIVSSIQLKSVKSSDIRIKAGQNTNIQLKGTLSNRINLKGGIR